MEVTSNASTIETIDRELCWRTRDGSHNIAPRLPRVLKANRVEYPTTVIVSGNHVEVLTNTSTGYLISPEVGGRTTNRSSNISPGLP
jgi:hypothetical protein